MCDKCKNNHKHYKCVCEKEFDNPRSLQNHKRVCKDYKQWKVEQEKIKLLEKESRRLPNGMFKCENPKCGNEHDGSYGSGRFCSKSCRCAANCQKQDYSKRKYSEDKKDRFTCKFCGRVIKSKSSLRNHEKHFCELNPNRDLNFGTRHDWSCNRCEFIGHSRRDLQNHIKECHLTGSIGANGKYCWNKGLTKETDERIAKNGQSVSNTMKQLYKNGYDNPNSPFCKSYWTEEKRKQRSNDKVALYKEHPEKHPNVTCASNRHNMTYPEKLAKDWLESHNIEFERSFFIRLDNKARYVDFYIPKYNLFLEIDGEHWHVEGNENDMHKDEIATKYGYITLRIRFPSMNVQNTLSDYFKQFGLV